MVLFHQLRVINVVKKFPAVTEWKLVQLKSQLYTYYIAEGTENNLPMSKILGYSL